MSSGIIGTGKPMVAKLERATFDDRADTWTTTTKLPLLDRSGAIVGTLGAVITSETSAVPEELLQQGHIAMNAAKSSGGNRFELYRSELAGLSQSGRGLAAELRRAIENSDLFVVYQPVMDLRDGSVLGAEALGPLASPRPGCDRARRIRRGR